MNITFVRRRWSATGGAENYLLRINRLLAGLGHTTQLVCEEWHSSKASEFHAVIPIHVHAGRAQAPKIFAEKANRYLERHATDCVFSLERGIRADIYRAGDGVHREWMRQRARFSPVRGRLSNWLNRKNSVVCGLEKFTFSVEGSKRVIANSQMVKKNILQNFDYPEECVEVILNGVDFEYFSTGDRQKGRAALGAGEDEKVVLLVGAGAERKGHIYAKKAAQEAGMRLMIIDQPQTCPMPSIYAAADVFILPTLYDPFANVTLEAMAAGLPVITTGSNGAGEAIQDGADGFVVQEASDVGRMTQILKRLADEKLRKKIGMAAQQTAKRHSLEKHIEQTIQLCEGVFQES